MSMEDYLYYSRRANEEDSAARSASCVAARLRHEELAGAYRARCALAAVLEGAVLPLIGPAVASHSRNRRQPTVARSAPALADSAATEPTALVRA